MHRAYRGLRVGATRAQRQNDGSSHAGHNQAAAGLVGDGTRRFVRRRRGSGGRLFLHGVAIVHEYAFEGNSDSYTQPATLL